MPTDIKNFYSRLISNYQDRTHWVESISYVLLNKPLDKIKDGEKSFLLMSLQDRFSQLDDYVEMHKNNDDKVVRLHITQNKEAAITKQVILTDKAEKDVEVLMNKLESIFTSDENVNIAAMIKLLKKKIK
jgi:hypothetical protein